MTHLDQDIRWMRAAIALGERGKGLTAPSPSVGCLIVKNNRLIARGWTQAGGRPHAEAMALSQAQESLRGATVYVTLEPCAHKSLKGPTCTDLLVDALPERIVIASKDPDMRTNGQGLERLKQAGIKVEWGLLEKEARQSMSGYFSRRLLGRPYITLKLATSLDGCIALENGKSHWITGERARAHAHLERMRSELIVVGRGTWEVDNPRLDVRLLGLEHRSPIRAVLGHGSLPPDWIGLEQPTDVSLTAADHVLVEGGAKAAAAFIKADIVDRILFYRAPILIGGGIASLSDIGLQNLAETHGRWCHKETRMLGNDQLDAYVRVTNATDAD
ncbi:MAG: bifunctional diaminohydroxyphosphoribosylaminopyrimidine deaminase/5-amino-6-(5-phosphoribosylamino)uracil reductase RibD [Zymomonas mobilis subsp. pomaceae]|uniref:Riboflavin biosynthesis protein RibD n=1 Tax=Zymomonas mobilis subsp. pomaceae (strain ATCC 29192 / DSM 22645 / JCM 10191 / CCUG 17912 / NBRC 13757 / NCIMB 11200 / NRRL B-4491 / Barker I) TaxID=579138 RepID=F8ES69_ZYMMT|nr:bifunctional diaminohydroxyphosphoribosylaminopyrimidine deaminase/5-amino-6-(5-phosphoribosylamino)uracil reductase RibD [Zymomonas mobilis]AEI37644.1 riboflavin biosynthesis protein RibD [Zymomonas mobilis subsp. pomaceae ATCC 29192]MDX5949011.1 bifunctional diaminohydroxyphosphoribosylaminopyrimidine deaminase/5-amino-6-(5-phosphoribosylamino)uracil reductase RibD [Zymomonas mobilis subsp. pomaceae]GEB88816.1 riboflavin biosynthesis protein RibD [Zymomonas mobilis subsp. pomaceae]